jgi:hypothetical protein
MLLGYSPRRNCPEIHHHSSARRIARWGLRKRIDLLAK